MTAFVHVLDTWNTGDRYCCPKRYLPKAELCREMDLREDPEKFTEFNVLIFGGGGLLHPGLEERMEALTASVHARGGKAFLWGAGSNYHGETDAVFGDWMASLDGVWIRDLYAPFPWCGCPSSMNTVFDSPPAAVHPMVALEHRDFPIPDLGVPKASNEFKTIEDTVAFIGSGECVITNTFHGALWSLFLGRRVILWKPFSSRFFTALPRILVTESEEEAVSLNGTRDADLLRRSRESQQRVIKILDQHITHE